MVITFRKRFRQVVGWLSVISATSIGVARFRRELIFVGISLAIAAVGFGMSGQLLDVEGIVGVAGMFFAIILAIRSVYSYQHILPDQETLVWRTRTLPAIDRFELKTRFPDILPSAVEQKAGFLLFHNPNVSKDTYMRSERFDNEFMLLKHVDLHILPSLKWGFFLLDEDRRRRQLQYLIARVRASNLRTTNDSKCRFRMDDEVPPTKIELARVGYFDSLMTNEAFRSELYQWRTDIEKEAEDGERINLTGDFPVHQDAFAIAKKSVRLDTLESSSASDHVGVTTLVVTSDRKLLMLRQGQTTIDASALLFGGSGSLDWKDIARSANSSDIRSILTTGMAREFLEETDAFRVYRRQGYAKKRDDQIRSVAENTLVIGYFRWVNRCGKPEFVGITRSTLKYDDLQGGDRFEVWPWRGDAFQLASLNDFAGIRDKIIEMVSQREFNLGLSAFVALVRMAEISGYASSEDPQKMQVYRNVSHHLGLS